MAMRVLLAGVSALILAGCNTMGGLYGNDEFSAYTQRSDTLTSGAGDAKEINRNVHVDRYWSRDTQDKAIYTSGARHEKAIECYEKRSGSGQPVSRSQTNSTIDLPSGTARSQTNSQTKNEC